MGGGELGDLGAVVDQLLGNHLGGRRHAERPGRAVAVVDVLVPFVTERPPGQHFLLTGLQRRHRRVPPEAEVSVLGGHFDGVGAAVDGEERAGQRVLGSPTVRRGAEARVTPGSCPLRARVDLGVLPGLLVGDHGPVLRARPVDRRLPSDLPVDLVAAEEGEVHPGVTRRLDVGPLVARPVLVVADRQEHVVVGQHGCPAAVGVDPRDVADVVAVALEPPDHGVLAAEEAVAAARGVLSDRERAVVAHLDRPAPGLTAVERVAAVFVVRLPRGVRRLEDDRRRALVVADHEDDVAGASRVVPLQPGDVHARNGVPGDGPARRQPPVPAVDESGGIVVQAPGLVLGKRGGRVYRGDEAGTVAAVPPRAIDPDLVVGGVGVDLEPDRVAGVDAHGGGKALDGLVTAAGDVPLRVWVTGLGVLADDRVGPGATRVGGGGSAGEGDHGKGAERHHQPEPRKQKTASRGDAV